MKERPIAFYAEIARELKSINAAIFYQQIRYWSDKGHRDDGWIYKTAEEIERETTLTEDKQRICKKKLIEKGWIKAEKFLLKGSMVWHYKLLIDFSFSMHPTGIIPVATPENPSCTTPENPSSSIQRIHTENTADVSLQYEEVDEKISTASPSRKFTNQRRAETGRPPIAPRKMSSQQEINFEVLKLLTHFRERVREEHRELHILEKRDEARNKKIAKLLKGCYEFFSYDEYKIKDMIEWWIEGAGEWCQYRPENCFMTTACEDFMNKDVKKDKDDNKGKWKCEYGHWHTKGQECGHGLLRQMEARSSQFASKLGEKFKVK